MKTNYQYILFDEIPSKTITSKWECRNRKGGDFLGRVKWFGPWRQYCFFASRLEPVFSAGCLADIQDFISQLMKARAA